MPAIRRALISVSDKRGVLELARGLREFDVEILSTGGTAKMLMAEGIPVVMVADYTGAPEILDGRVKTLHPKIHGGLLGRSIESHQREMEREGIAAIDLVVVNLYPFEETVAKPGVALADAIENIDIGGPSMLRSAAKNHERVAVLSEPGDYEKFLGEMRKLGGEVSPETRFALARKAFAHTAAYDGAISAYLSSTAPGSDERARFPETLTVQWERVLELRYGENPHQEAAFYRDRRNPLGPGGKGPSIASAEVLQGKALSYNNILDLDAALAACAEHEAPTAVVVKHTNPCGVARSEGGVADAYLRARACDPISAFGGIVAVNREVDVELAESLLETFLECIVAPKYSDAAREALARKSNLRLVAAPGLGSAGDGYAMRSVAGGLLVQTADVAQTPIAEAQVVTKRAPSPAELESLDFAWRVAKHIKSNAILFCQGTATAAVGAGQMSRVDAAKIAVMKAQTSLEGSVVASDAFFPFRDGLDSLAEAGATAVIQPGGSKRDPEVIAAADEHGMAMLFTGKRHFRH